MNSNSIPRQRRSRAHLWMPLALAASLAACGGGSSTGASTGSTQVATFIDSPVEGLTFRSSTLSGLTDRNGNFPYMPGETVTFSIGNIVLGSLKPNGDKVTPLQLVPGAANATDARVTRILRTLQSLDSDGNPENGIQITAWAREITSLKTKIRLDDNGITDDEVKQRLPSGDYTRTAEDARKHYEDHQGDKSNGYLGYNNSGSGTGTPVAQPANTAGRLLASNCFQCHGTLGRGGFDDIRGGKAGGVSEYFSKTANSDIMAAHAQGYTRAQLDAIVAYLNQP
ncbi:MAG: hypothetical protein KGN32_10755 [Burkholderiales bacterium]|nr:hypothetical protein [Burkholderiales bacterium]